MKAHVSFCLDCGIDVSWKEKEFTVAASIVGHIAQGCIFHKPVGAHNGGFERPRDAVGVTFYSPRRKAGVEQARGERAKAAMAAEGYAYCPKCGHGAAAHRLWQDHEPWCRAELLSTNVELVDYDVGTPSSGLLDDRAPCAQSFRPVMAEEAVRLPTKRQRGDAGEDRDCGECPSCLDKPKFGGLGRKKARCVAKRATSSLPLARVLHPKLHPGGRNAGRDANVRDISFRASRDPGCA